MRYSREYSADSPCCSCISCFSRVKIPSHSSRFPCRYAETTPSTRTSSHAHIYGLCVDLLCFHASDTYGPPRKATRASNTVRDSRRPSMLGEHCLIDVRLVAHSTSTSLRKASSLTLPTSSAAAMTDHTMANTNHFSARPKYPSASLSSPLVIKTCGGGGVLQTFTLAHVAILLATWEGSPSYLRNVSTSARCGCTKYALTIVYNRLQHVWDSSTSRRQISARSAPR